MFEPVDPKVSFPKQEEKILAFWKEERVFERSIEQREKGAGDYTFYDGPPFATGLPHFGHFVPSVIKDIVPRYHAMKGKRVERRFGWDCHGLPVETLVEQELGVNSNRHRKVWRRQVQRGLPGIGAALCQGVARYHHEAWPLG